MEWNGMESEERFFRIISPVATASSKPAKPMPESSNITVPSGVIGKTTNLIFGIVCFFNRL